MAQVVHTQSLFNSLLKNPGDRKVIDELKIELGSTDMLEAKIALLRSYASAAGDGSRTVAELYVVAGTTALGTVGKQELGDRLMFDAILALPERPESWLAVRTAYERTDNWLEFAVLMDKVAEALRGDQLKVLALMEAGNVWENRLNRPIKAMENYQAAFRLEPGSVKALRAARRIYAKLGKWDMTVRLLQQELKRIDSTVEKVAVLRELVDILEVRLGDVEGAAPYRAALDVIGSGTGAHRPGSVPDLAIGAGSMVYSELASDSGPDPGPGPGTRDEAFMEWGMEAGGRLLTQERAGTEEIAQALEAVPETKIEAGKLAEVNGGTGENGAEDGEPLSLQSLDYEHGHGLMGRSGEIGGRKPAADTLFQIIRSTTREEPVLDEKLGSVSVQDSGTGRKLGTDSTAIAGTAGRAVGGAGARITGSGAGARGGAGGGTGGGAGGGGSRFGRPGSTGGGRNIEDILASVSNQALAEKLHELWEQAELATSEDDAQSLRSEIELLAKGDWRNLLNLYNTRFGQDPVLVHTRLATMAELAEVGSRAVESWRQVLTVDPLNMDAREALKTIGIRDEKWQLVLDVLRTELDAIPESDEDARVAVILEMIDIYRDRLNHDVMVATLYAQIVKIDPTNEDALDQLAAQYEKARRWPDLVGVLQQKLELAGNPADQVAILKQIASVYVTRFSNHAEGIKAYEAILGLDPADDEAVTYLKEMYQKRRDWDKFIELSLSEADQVSDPRERVKRLLETAKLASERMQRSPLVGELWQRVLDQEPDNLIAIAALEEFHERQKNWEELAQVLQTHTGLVKGADRIATLEKLGILYSDRMKDGERAVAVWQSVLEEDPTHFRARDAYKKSLIDARQWDELEDYFIQSSNEKELVRILESQVGIIPEPAAKVELLVRTARLWREVLGQEDRATRAMERVLQYDESNFEAAVALIPYYEERKNWRRLQACLEIRIAGRGDGGEQGGGGGGGGAGLESRAAGVWLRMRENALGNMRLLLAGQPGLSGNSPMKMSSEVSWKGSLNTSLPGSASLKYTKQYWVIRLPRMWQVWWLLPWEPFFRLGWVDTRMLFRCSTRCSS